MVKLPSISRKAKVRFLVHQKFPRLIAEAPSKRRPSASIGSSAEIKAEQYLSELGKLSDIEIDNEYEKAVKEVYPS